MPKRPEIEVKEFIKTVESKPIAIIPCDSRLFGEAANNGQMIAEVSASHSTSKMFVQMAQRLTGKGETRKPRSSLLAPLMNKLRARA
jgi:pilus assembly protein CpaE